MSGSNFKDFSLHILDIALNSISAGASLIKIAIIETPDRFIFQIEDNGPGMDLNTQKKAVETSFTTKKRGQGGQGLPLLQKACRERNGSLIIKSNEGIGTTVTATFKTAQNDIFYSGSMAETMSVLVFAAEADFVYSHKIMGKEFTLDTRELKKVTKGLVFNSPAVADWVYEYITERLLEIRQ